MASEPVAHDEQKGASWWLRLRELFRPFLPDWANKLVDGGLLKLALGVVGVVFVLPLVMALLAASWLSVLKGIDKSYVAGPLGWYLDVINDGFSIEEVSRRSNKRLDYLQTFAFSFQLDGRNRTTHWEMPIIVYPRQRAEFRVKVANLHSTDMECSVPERTIDLVNVSLGGKLVATLRDESTEPTLLKESWWSAFLRGRDVNDATPLQSLTFDLAPAAAEFKCGEVRVEGSLGVFKDFVKTTAVGTDDARGVSR